MVHEQTDGPLGDAFGMETEGCGQCEQRAVLAGGGGTDACTAMLWGILQMEA